MPHRNEGEPVIPIGLGTKLGLSSAALFSLVALVAAVMNGDHTTETITALIIAGVSVVRTVDGRMAQGAALVTAAPVAADEGLLDPALLEEDTQEFDVLCNPQDEVKDLHDADPHLER